MDLASIIHYADNRWCMALEPGRFLIRLRAGRGDLRAVRLHTRDKYIPVKYHDTRAVTTMRLAARDTVADYFEAELDLDLICLRYFFELEDGEGRRIFYSNYTFRQKPPEDKEDMFDCPQQLREEERRRVPDWARGRVIYQIFPASFASSRPRALGGHRGDLRGIISRLDYLRDLGVEVIYMTPVFRARSVHKYDTVDYYSVDPSFGTEEDLRELTARAHAMGMRVILDAVFNHTSRDFFAFADIVKNGGDSKYLPWYHIRGLPLRAQWGQKPSYLTFGYVPGMPKLDLRNPETEEYFINVGLYWLGSCGIDGWRLDVGDEVGRRFWRRFREAVRAKFPDALIVGEEWHFGGDYLEGDAWDTVMNYPFRDAVVRLLDGTYTVSDFLGALGFLRGNLHPDVCRALWDLVGSHDTPRILNVCGGDRAKHRLAAALQLLLPGSPMIYYGDEVGMDGGPDPDCRRDMVWDPAKQDAATLDWYRRLIAIRRAHPCIALGEPVACDADDASGLLTMTFSHSTGGLTVAFHCAGGLADLPEFAGEHDLITSAPFIGTLGPWSAAVFRTAGPTTVKEETP